MKIKLYWEQESVETELPDGGCSPVTLLEAVGEKGREMLLEVLVINYRQETKAMIREVEHFETRNFK